MAAKKAKVVDEITEEVMVEEPVAETVEPVEKKEPAKKAAKKPQKEKVFVPQIPGEEPYITVGVNGKYTQVRRGQWVEVDRSVASVIRNSQKQMVEAEATQTKLQNQHIADL